MTTTTTSWSSTDWARHSQRPARTVEVTVRLRVRVSDQATEGEILDSVLAAAKAITPHLRTQRGSCKVEVAGSEVVAIGEPGGSL